MQTMPSNQQTQDAIKAALQGAVGLAHIIQAHGTIPSGHLYARIMEHISLDAYQRLLGVLKKAGLVKESSSHLLTWVGEQNPQPSNHN